MNGGVISFALRETRRDLGRRATWVGLIGAGLILGISGPFDTLRMLPLGPRLIYWVFVVATAFSLGNFISTAVGKMLAQYKMVYRIIACTLAISLPVTALIVLTNGLLFEIWPGNPAEFIGMIAVVTAISAVIETAATLLHPATDPPQSAILARLPFDKRGTLIAMSATDHYVDVATSKRNTLILMRLADAIKEAGVAGLHVHRSHWVASGQITAARRQGDRAILTMSNGAEIPVSRSNLPALKSAGFLPI